MKIGIVGFGHVGKLMKKTFPESLIFDPFLKIGSKEEINICEVAFICVPTDMLENGDCDTSIVEECINWINSELIIIRSTVPVGFTDKMVEKYKKRIVFQPEYYGETQDHPFNNPIRDWLSFGGESSSVDIAIKAYQLITNSEVKFFQSNAIDVEMAKYMENSFLATKVTFVNEMFDISQALGVDFNKAREIWLADPRIGRSHTFVYEDKRGFSGKCLPKDVSSIKNQAKNAKVNTLLLDVIVEKNNFFLNKNSKN